jgi:hypothetical protein
VTEWFITVITQSQITIQSVTLTHCMIESDVVESEGTSQHSLFPFILPNPYVLVVISREYEKRSIQYKKTVYD